MELRPSVDSSYFDEIIQTAIGKVLSNSQIALDEFGDEGTEDYFITMEESGELIVCKDTVDGLYKLPIPYYFEDNFSTLRINDDRIKLDKLSIEEILSKIGDWVVENIDPNVFD